MVKINVIDYIESGFSTADAEKISPIIDEKLMQNDKIQLDFNNVKFYTTLFFNTALTRLLENMKIDEYKRRIDIVNLSEVGLETYNHSLEHAIEFYSLSKEEREARNKIIAEIMNEEGE